MKVSREDVLSEAARQFNRRGVRSTVLKDVAAALGVTRMAIYWYVEDREDLVHQCYSRTCETLEAHLAEAETAAGPLAALDAFLDRALAGPELSAIVEPGLLPDGRRQEIVKRFDGVTARLARLLQAGAEAGVMRACDFDFAARSIISLVFWASVADLWNIAPTPGGREELIACAKDFSAWGRAAERRLPDFAPIDLTPLSRPMVDAFDRDSITAAKREQILAAASQLFNRRGVDSTRLDEIAAELGATTGAIYHYVGGKPAVLSECFLRTLRFGVTLQQAANEAAGSRAASLAAFQHAWAMVQMRPDLSPLFPLTGFEALPGAGREAFHDETLRLGELTLAHCEAGVAEGSLRPLDLYAMRLQGGLLGWLSRAGIEDPLAREAMAREAAAQLLLGVRALP